MGFRLQVFHLLWSGFPSASPNRCTATTGSYDPREQALGFRLFRFRSPLLTESHSISSPPLTEMFHFSGSCVLRSMNSIGDDPVLTGTGYPIRKSAGRGLFAAHRGLSQLITSFFACWHQGIHHALLVALFLRYLEISNLCNHRADDRRAAIAQTQQIVEVAFNLPCMRMSKSLPWDGPAAA